MGKWEYESVLTCSINHFFITATLKIRYPLSIPPKTSLLFNFNLTSLGLGWAFERQSHFGRANLRTANQPPTVRLKNGNNQEANRNVKMQIAPQNMPQHRHWAAEWDRWDANTILSFALPTLACSALAAHVGLSLSDKTLTFTISASL